ncbi:hypothetical protein AmDm5_2690 [Acetobacter malorum]|nr:hypothetical protein AmDm5_2690 [Acetobacter malorum]
MAYHTGCGVAIEKHEIGPGFISFPSYNIFVTVKVEIETD